VYWFESLEGIIFFITKEIGGSDSKHL